MLVNGVGLSFSQSTCALAIYSCISFYGLSKVCIPTEIYGSPALKLFCDLGSDLCVSGREGIIECRVFSSQSLSLLSRCILSGQKAIRYHDLSLWLIGYAP
jgi:hypothetical protein